MMDLPKLTCANKSVRAPVPKRWLRETKKVEPQIKQILKDLATKYWWNAYGWEWEKIEAALRE